MGAKSETRDLQWSHALSSVETPALHHLDERDGRPSMEPRSFERGDALVGPANHRPRVPSMEPRSFERGDAAWGVRLWCDRRPSMEPRSFERGDKLLGRPLFVRATAFNGATLFRAWRPLHLIAHYLLRWKPSMEPRSFERGDPVAAVDACRANDPSMEPRSFERGDLLYRVQRELGLVPSMEPRSFERGDFPPVTCLPANSYLQWSHALSSVETPSVRLVFRGRQNLQWSHALSSVETAGLAAR